MQAAVAARTQPHDANAICTAWNRRLAKTGRITSL
jgi:hypothetical protein